MYCHCLYSYRGWKMNQTKQEYFMEENKRLSIELEQAQKTIHQLTYQLQQAQRTIAAYQRNTLVGERGEMCLNIDSSNL